LSFGVPIPLVNISYSDLADPANSTIVKKVGSGVQGAICGAYHNYKDWYHQNIDIGSPAGEILEGFWDNICPAEPPYTPPATPPPFTGGQCVCDYYKVYLQSQSQTPDGYTSPFGSFEARVFGPIGGAFGADNDEGGTTMFLNCRGGWGNGCSSSNFDMPLTGTTGGTKLINISIVLVQYNGFYSDNCGNPPGGSSPPPPAPPDIINDNITIINNDGVSVEIPVSFNPQIFMPDLNLNAKAFVFKPELNFSPQFNINQPPGGSNLPPPSLNFDFGPNSVDVTIGPGGSSSNKEFNNTTNFNNIIDIKDNLSDINIDIKKVADSLDCDPCEQLKEIKDILTYKPTYTSASINNFQSITRDNLFNLGYLEIELSKLPHSTKIIFGGDSPNAMYTGWLFWRHNQFNFEKIIIHSAKSVYHAPKWANGFAICCSHGAKANVFYYTEVK